MTIDDRSVVSDELWRIWSHRRTRLRHKAFARVLKMLAFSAGLAIAALVVARLFLHH